MIKKIVTPNDYEEALTVMEGLMKKGEVNITDEENEIIGKLAEMVEAYEDKKGMTPLSSADVKAAGNDTEKIVALLGFEPDLIELVEFKLYQLKMKQNALAEMLNMPASKISQILNRKREPDVAFLKGIHEKLSIDGNFLLEAVGA